MMFEFRLASHLLKLRNFEDKRCFIARMIFLAPNIGWAGKAFASAVQVAVLHRWKHRERLDQLASDFNRHERLKRQLVHSYDAMISANDDRLLPVLKIFLLIALISPYPFSPTSRSSNTFRR